MSMSSAKGLLSLVALMGAGFACADASDKLRRLEGYTIILATTVVGYVDADGKRKDSFEGCDHDRVIIFDNDRVLKCATYSYTYSYRPTAIVFAKGGDFKMLVGNDLYDMRR